jgi:hypothetical protein
MRDANVGFSSSFMTAAGGTINNNLFNTNPLSGAGGTKDPSGGNSNTVQTILLSPTLRLLNPEDCDFVPGTKPPPIPPGGIPSVGEGGGVGF